MATDGREHAREIGRSYYGDAVGHWQGASLVIDTIGLLEDNDVVMGFPAGSERLLLQERWHWLSADLLQAGITVDGVDTLAKPYVQGQRYRRCANGLNLTPPPAQPRGP